MLKSDPKSSDVGEKLTEAFSWSAERKRRSLGGSESLSQSHFLTSPAGWNYAPMKKAARRAFIYCFAFRKDVLKKTNKHFFNNL